MVILWTWVFCSTNYFPRLYLFLIGRFSAKTPNIFYFNTILLNNKIFTIKMVVQFSINHVYFLHPRKPRKYTLTWFCCSVDFEYKKVAVENFFKSYFIKIIYLFYIQKKVFCNDFNSNFWTSLCTLFIAEIRELQRSIII